MEPDKLTRLLCGLVIPIEREESQVEARRRLSREELDALIEECMRPSPEELAEELQELLRENLHRYPISNEPQYPAWLIISSFAASIVTIVLLICMALQL